MFKGVRNYLALLFCFYAYDNIYAADSESNGWFRGLSLELVKPTLTETKGFKELFGREPWYPAGKVSITRRFFVVDCGLFFRSGVFVAQGRAFQKDGKTISDTAKTELLLIPADIGVSLSFAPLFRDVVDFTLWLGVEGAYFRDERLNSDEGEKSSEGKEIDYDQKSYINNGWKKAYFFGASVGLNLNFIDKAGIKRLRGYTGFHTVFLDLTYNQVKQTDKALSFSRSEFGIRFRFLGQY